MIETFNDNINAQESLDSKIISFTGAAVETIPAVEGARSALLQFYTDVAGLAIIGSNPLVVIDETGVAVHAGYVGVRGFMLPNMSFYAVNGVKNLSRAKFIPFAVGYNVYCKITYFKAAKTTVPNAISLTGEEIAIKNALQNVGGTAIMALQSILVKLYDASVQGIDIDNAALTANKPVPTGGKAVQTATYAPAYTAGDSVLASFDKDNGGINVNQANLNAAEDTVTAIKGESTKQTYSASITGLVAVAAATDIFEIIGSATKLVRIKRIQISGSATAATAIDFNIVKRSTANTLGASTVPVPVPHDSNNIAGSAALKAYTANPTLGAIVGVMRSMKKTLTTPGGAIPNVPTVIEFGNNGEQNLILRAVTESLSINFNGQTIAGNLLNIDITWTEE